MQTKKQLRKQLAQTRRERDELKQIVKECHDKIRMYRYDLSVIGNDLEQVYHYCSLCNTVIQAETEIERMKNNADSGTWSN